MLDLTIGNILPMEKLDGSTLDVRVLKLVDHGMYCAAPLSNPGDWLTAQAQGDRFVQVDVKQVIDNAGRAVLGPVPASAVAGRQYWKTKKKK